MIISIILIIIIFVENSINVEQALKDKNIEQIYLTSGDSGLFWNQCGYKITYETGYRNEDPIYIKKINKK